MQAGAVERAVVHDHQRPVGRKPHVGLDGAESRRLCQPDGFQRVFARYGAAHVHAAVGDEHPFAGACRGVGGGLAQGRRTPCERGEKEQERIFHGRKFVADGGLSSVFSLRFLASAQPEQVRLCARLNENVHKDNTKRVQRQIYLSLSRGRSIGSDACFGGVAAKEVRILSRAFVRRGLQSGEKGNIE